MARGSLPEQTPAVPENVFFAFNDLYLYVRQLNTALAEAEAEIAGLEGAKVVKTLAVDEATAADVLPIDLTNLSWTFEANSVYKFTWIGNMSPDAATTGCGFQLKLT